MAIAYNSAYVQTETLNITFSQPNAVGHVDGGDSLAREASTFSQTRLTAYCPSRYTLPRHAGCYKHACQGGSILPTHV